MNRSELAAAIAPKAGITKAKATEVLTALFGDKNSTGVIAKAVKSGDKVAVAGFGTWKPTSRAARDGKNPTTGATIKIPAKKGIKFLAGSTLKAAVA